VSRPAAIPVLLNWGANGFGGFFDEGRAAPLFFSLADAKQKIAEDFGTAIGVAHFGMEFNGVDLALRVFYRGDGVVGAADGAKSGGKTDDVVAMTVPDAERIGKFGKELGLVGGAVEIENGAALLEFLERPPARRGANDRAGPRGPSGVIATSCPFNNSRESPTSARLAPRDVDPRTVRKPNASATRAINSPSRCSLISTATPSLRW